ncbi:hypothetical protein MNBD_BACTEROID07-1001 [hydrothermal vent metagenome]|uniref:Glycosyl transferase family 1 domain-containing protein n=1 Tax=hydrothermal vent metagenome TaxID=652676 RepID=A0A3B0UGF5_9ZZZZ
MKIAIDARIISTTTGRYVERLATYLQRIDDENEYLVLVKKKDLDYWKPKNKNFKVVEADFREFSFSEQISFYRFLNCLGADLVHFTMPHHPILYRRPFVTTIHDLTMFSPIMTPGNTIKNSLIYKLKLPVYSYVFKRSARKAKSVITDTVNTKVDLVRKVSRFDPEKATVTYLAADKITAKAEAVKNLKDKEFLFFVGRAWPYKNIKTLIDGYAIAKEKHPELQLALAGKKESFYEELEAYAKDKGIKDVHFLGFVSEGELRWLYENATAYVFPSFAEGFGLPGLEAMIHGAPVLSSSATCLPEVYGEGALYFDPNSPEGLADLVNKLMSHPDLRRDLVEDGKKQAKKYSWQRMAQQTHEIYLDALSSK